MFMNHVYAESYVLVRVKFNELGIYVQLKHQIVYHVLEQLTIIEYTRLSHSHKIGLNIKAI